MSKVLFLAWQDPDGRRWFPVGRLAFDGSRYQFVYIRGAREARDRCGFHPLHPFPSFETTYESSEMFPLFSNRVPRRSRPDYKDYVSRLNVPENADDPMALLARSGGRRATDSLEVFPYPHLDESGRYHIHFFAHGLRYMSPESVSWVERLEVGERLLLVHDFQNPHDRHALILRTNDAVPGDGHRYMVGYCPGYLLRDAFEILLRCADDVEVAVERVNPPPAPLQVRLLCNMTACWPEDFRPFTAEIYQPIVPEATPIDALPHA